MLLFHGNCNIDSDPKPVLSRITVWESGQCQMLSSPGALSTDTSYHIVCHHFWYFFGCNQRFSLESWSTSICLYVQKYSTLCIVCKKKQSRGGWRKVFGSCTRKQLSAPVGCPNSYNCARVSQSKMLCANKIQPLAPFHLLKPSLPLLSIISFSVDSFASMFWVYFSDVLFLYQGITAQCNFVYMLILSHINHSFILDLKLNQDQNSS